MNCDIYGYISHSNYYICNYNYVYLLLYLYFTSLIVIVLYLLLIRFNDPDYFTYLAFYN